MELLEGVIISGLVALIGIEVRNLIWVWRIYEMHNVRNNSGRPIWYVQPSLEESIKGLTESVAQHAKATNMLSQLVDVLMHEVKNVPREVVREMTIQRSGQKS